MGSTIGKILNIDDGSAAREQMARQSQAIAQQQAAAKERESKLAQETQERIIARRAGGQRMLLSQERADASLGIQDKLGG